MKHKTEKGMESKTGKLKIHGGFKSEEHMKKGGEKKEEKKEHKR